MPCRRRWVAQCPALTRAHLVSDTGLAAATSAPVFGVVLEGKLCSGKRRTLPNLCLFVWVFLVPAYLELMLFEIAHSRKYLLKSQMQHPLTNRTYYLLSKIYPIEANCLFYSVVL